MAEMDLAAAIAHFDGAAVAMEAEKHRLLERAAKIVEREAKRAIGHDEYEAGQFGPWPDLADSTIAEKDRLGYFGHVSANDSLLRTGALRESIGHVVGDDEAVVGSNDPNAVWQELGTGRGIPPRPFLAGAASRRAEQVAELLGRGVVQVLLGGKPAGAIE